MYSPISSDYAAQPMSISALGRPWVRLDDMYGIYVGSRNKCAAPSWSQQPGAEFHWPRYITHPTLDELHALCTQIAIGPNDRPWPGTDKRLRRFCTHELFFELIGKEQPTGRRKLRGGSSARDRPRAGRSLAELSALIRQPELRKKGFPSELTADGRSTALRRGCVKCSQRSWVQMPGPRQTEQIHTYLDR